MATETLRPNAAGDETNIPGLAGSATHWGAVDDVVQDGSSTQVYTTIYSTYYRDLYNIPSPSGSGTINFVKVIARCYAETDTGYVKLAVKTGGTVYESTVKSVDWASWDYLYNNIWTTNPATGLPWTWSDIESLQIGIALTRSYYATACRCTQVYVEVNYTPPITPPTAHLNLTAYIPTVSFTGSEIVTPTTAHLLLTTYAPILTISPVTIKGGVTTRVECMDYMSQLSTGIVKDYDALGLVMTYISQSWSYGGDIYVLVDDDDYWYAAGGGDHAIRKFSKSTGAQVAESAAQDNNIWALAVDDDFVYAGLQRDAPYNDYVVGKFTKSALALVLTSPDYGCPIYALEHDDTYVYAVGEVTTARVRKYLKSNMTYVAQSGAFNAAIKAMTSDTTYLYIGVYYPAPYNEYTVYKITKSTMAYGGAETADFGSTIRSLANDDTYVYAGGEGGIVRKYLKTDLSLIVSSASYGGYVLAIEPSIDYIYVAGATTNKIYRLFIGNLVKSDESPSYGGAIYGLIIDGEYIYAAGVTYYINKYQLFQYIDEVIDELLAFPMQPPDITVGDISDYASEVVPLNIDGQTILQAILALRKAKGGYIDVNNDRELDWFTTIGEDKGQQIRYGKNLLGIYREIDYTKLFNRIYVYGRDADGNRIQLSDIQAEDYVEDTDSQDTYGDGVNPYIGVAVFVDFSITGADALLAWANELLAQYKDPPTSYRIDAIDLSVHSGFEFEALQLGSTVTVIDEDLGIEVETTVVRIFKPDLSRPHEMQVELENAVRDITNTMANLTQGQKKHDILLVNP